MLMRFNETEAVYLITIWTFILLAIGIPVGLMGALVYFQGWYACYTILVVVVFFVAFILIRQKRLPIYALILLTGGFFFLTSAIIGIGFDMFTQNMSIHGQIEFSKAMRPNQVASGFGNIGAGILSVAAAIAEMIKNGNAKRDDAQNKPDPMRKTQNIAWFAAGVLFLGIGILSVFSGLQPL